MTNDVKSNRKGNSKPFIISFVIFIIIGGVLYSLYNREHKKLLTLMEDQKVSLTDKITARDSVINEWILTFNEIEKNLATIKEKEKIITLSSSDVEFSKDQRDRILEDIKYINTLLDQNKKKIASLNAQLKKSGGTIKALQVKIAELEASMKQSESEISDLKTTLADKNFKIEQLNAEMTEMQVTIEQKDAEIVNKTAELNKAWYAYGTFKELKAKGIVTKEGGFIGLGKKISLIENFPDSAFTLINITETKSIPVNSKDAKLITEHPAGSYELIRKNNIVESVEIKDPAQFWKISKYAVVELLK
jgi:peptidoglycan hydrolase CwlO-like protein